MKIRLLLVLILLLATGLAQAQEVEPTWLEVADVPLSLLSGPSSDDDIITRLTPREAVELIERGEQWSQVRRQDGLTGWAHNDYLLPWDERNRIDAQRRVGERRLFRITAGQQGYADLRAISDHSYIYTLARHPDSFVPSERDLKDLGRDFDRRIYRQALDLWGVDDPPAIDGDDRIVILLASGFVSEERSEGWYSGRHDLPNEADPAGTGYLGIMLQQGRLANFARHSWSGNLFFLARGFGYLLHDHVVGRHHAGWVRESFATLTESFLKFEHDLYGSQQPRIIGATSAPSNQLNGGGSGDPGYLFLFYLRERLGPEMLRDFASHPRQGLAALDDLLAVGGHGMDADTFFADWVLANHLNDVQREGGRYGYRILQDNARWSQAAPPNRIRQLPTGIRDSAPQYAARYYELPLAPDVSSADRLLLDFRPGSPASQDAWLQLVQVLPGRIDVQRFRASDYRDQPVLAELREGAERVFVAISPVSPTARHQTRPVHYSLALRLEPLSESDRAQVTAALNLRSAPQIADNVLGTLQRCSVVQVLRREEQWSQVLASDGQTGWSHNDYLFYLSAPSPVASANPCAELTRAAHDGDLAAVQRLLAGGASVNAADAFGRTALHEAAFWGHARVMERLLRAGADPQSQDIAGRTALDDVVASGDVNSILLMLRAGTGLDPADPIFGPLMIDAAGAGNRELLDLFLGNGHDINWRDDEGRSALAAAAGSGHDAMLRKMLAAGAAAEQADGQGRSPLMLAAAGGKHSAFAPLLDAGVDVNRHDIEGHSALTLAAANGHALSVAWLLLGSDADVHHRLPDSGRNALHLAAAAGHADAIAMLLLGEADPAARDAGGLTALQLAEAAGHRQAMNYLRMPVTRLPSSRLRPSDEERNALLAAAAAGDLTEVERFLGIESRSVLFSYDREGLSVLMLAARAGHPDVVLRLLLAGAEPDVRRNTGWDEPAIFFTIRGGHDDLTAMLLLAGATPASRPMSWPFKSALTWAADFGREEIVHLLLALRDTRYIDINVRDHSDWTPLLPAALNGHTNIVRSLLAAGADPNLRTLHPYNQSILAWCAGSCSQEIRNMLLDAAAKA